jgi:hypothetical protein
VTRFLALLALLAAAAEAAPAQAAPAPAPQRQAIARNCSFAMNGDLINSNILICPVVAILQGIADVASSQDVDPLLLQLIRQESFDEALRRVERLVAGGVKKPAVYLSIGASLSAARGRREEALSFAKRAYEADPADSMLLLRYYAALSANGRAEEAAALIGSSDRRRAQLKGVGQHLLDVAKLELEYPYERLNAWRESLDRCLSQSSGPPRAARARGRRAARCALDPAAQQSLRALRERALRLEQALAAAEPDARMPLQTRHYLLQYALVADELLQDPAQAAKTEWRMTGLGREILKRFGPWSYMLALQSEYRLELIATPAHLRLKYQLFDLALDSAPASPIVNLGAGTADEDVLPKLSGIMMAGARISRAMAANRMDENAVAWKHLRLATQEAARYGNLLQAIGIRLAALRFAAQLIGPADPNFDRKAVASEHRRLKAAFGEDPELGRSHATILADISSTLCGAGVLAKEDCAGG